MDFLRASGEKRYELAIRDAKPVENADAAWEAAAQFALIGIFVILLGVLVYIGRPVIMPVVAGVIIATILSPIVRTAAGYGIRPPITALVLALVVVGLVSLAVTLVAGPVSEWIARGPEIGALIKEKFAILERPLAALKEIQHSLTGGGTGPAVQVEAGQAALVAPVVAFVTPAAAQILLFVGTLLFYLIGQQDFRRRFAMLFADREARLRFLRITSDIERNLTGYIGVFTVINIALGTVVALGAWAFGFPNPVIFGVIAAILNYIPYIGPGITAFIIFAVGLVSFPTLGQALLPMLCFVAVTTVEGHFITPAVIGRRLTLNPFMVFLALAFWTWMWGPVGSFLAVPLCIVAIVTFHHLYPTEDTAKLPG